MIELLVDSAEPAIGHPQALAPIDGALSSGPGARLLDGLLRIPLRAASRPAVAADLVASGLRVAQIDCRRGDPSIWRMAVANVRRAAERRHSPVAILMNLAGSDAALPFGLGGRCPVLELHPGGEGHQLEPALAQLVSAPEQGAHLMLDRIAVPIGFVNRLVPGDRIELTDALGKSRKLRVVGVNEWGAVVRAKRPVTLVEGTMLRFGRDKGLIGGLAEGGGTPPWRHGLSTVVELADLIAVPLPTGRAAPDVADALRCDRRLPGTDRSMSEVLIVHVGGRRRAAFDELTALLGAIERQPAPEMTASGSLRCA